MLKITRVMIGALFVMGLSSVASAQTFDPKNMFFGGGLSQNKVSGLDSAMGFQFFGGYSFGQIAPQLQMDAEVGYMQTGKMKISGCPANPFFACELEAKGVWANGVARYRVAPQIDLIGRAGLDFGDDDGFMIGIGAGYLLNKNTQLRLEYVMRDNVDSLQFNFVYQP
jgi:hypothetical protein